MSAGPTQHLDRTGGRIAYDVEGQGLPVILVPGAGDVRSHHAALADLLVERGFMAVRADLRGHGDSDAGFDTYDLPALAEDLLALIDVVGGRAALVAEGATAGAAVLAAVRRGGRVAGLVLVSPRVRGRPAGLADRTLGAAAQWRPWGPALWVSYYRSLYPGQPPDHLKAHVRDIRTALARPGHWQAAVSLSRTSTVPAAAALAEVNVRVLVVVGAKDRELRDAAAEGTWVTQQVHGRRLIVANAGHHPAAEYPEVVGPEVVRFLSKLKQRTAPPARPSGP